MPPFNFWKGPLPIPKKANVHTVTAGEETVGYADVDYTDLVDDNEIAIIDYLQGRNNGGSYRTIDFLFVTEQDQAISLYTGRQVPHLDGTSSGYGQVVDRSQHLVQGRGTLRVRFYGVIAAEELYSNIQLRRWKLH